MLFCGSLRHNLDPSGDAADSAVWAALEHAHLAPTIRALPLGLQHELTEAGENFR